MEDKIEVGEYVKFKEGSIDRIKDIINTHSDRKLIAFEQRNSYLSDLGLKRQIVKHSKNIIDLIEEGDYVNGYKITDKISNYLYTEILNLNGDYKTICDYMIKSIVTKEQFESVAYEVEVG